MTNEPDRAFTDIAANAENVPFDVRLEVTWAGQTKVFICSGTGPTRQAARGAIASCEDAAVTWMRETIDAARDRL